MTLISRFGALSIIANDRTVWQIEDRAEMLLTSNPTNTTVLVIPEVYINDYDAIETSFSTGAGIRDNLRENLAEHADADRIFEHAEQLETPATTRKWAKEASEAMEVEEVRAWYSGQEWKRGHTTSNPSQTHIFFNLKSFPNSHLFQPQVSLMGTTSYKREDCDRPGRY